VVAKLRECQTSPRLTDAESVGFPLAVWKRWEPDPGPTAWVRMRLQDSSNVWQLLRSAAAIERSADEEKITDIDIQWLGKIIPLSEVDRALDVAKQVKLSKEQQMLVDFYDRAKSRAEPSPSTTS